jgi:hypothetical protein
LDLIVNSGTLFGDDLEAALESIKPVKSKTSAY